MVLKVHGNGGNAMGTVCSVDPPAAVVFEKRCWAFLRCVHMNERDWIDQPPVSGFVFHAAP